MDTAKLAATDATHLEVASEGVVVCILLLGVQDRHQYRRSNLFGIYRNR
jgi:hypothetical protein